MSMLSNFYGEDFKLWRTWYNHANYSVDYLDRAEYFKFPIRTEIYNRCRLPDNLTNLTYKECCNITAHEIFIKADSLKTPIAVLWSGGIDSTRVLVSFLENYPLSELRDKIKVICDRYSIIEHPRFYKQFILPNFEIINSENLPWLFDRSLIIVTGEMNDQLFVATRYKEYSLSYFNDNLEILSQDRIFKFVNSKIKNELASSKLVNAVLQSAAKYGIQLTSDADWFWWWNFGFKWQFAYLRLFTLAMPRLWSNLTLDYDHNYFFNFFSSENFQSWSIKNPSVRCFRDWRQYKMSVKQDIYAFDKDIDYLENKTKKNSLTTIFRHRERADTIDVNFSPYKNFSYESLYDSTNSFLF